MNEMQASRKSGYRSLRRTLVFLLSLLAVVFLAMAWMLYTRSGMEAAVALVERLTNHQVVIEAPEGRLAGPFKAGSVRYVSEGLIVDIRDLRLAWQPVRLWHRKLQVDLLSAAEVTVSYQSAQNEEKTPLQPPAHLKLPLGLEVSQLRLDRFALNSPGVPEPLFEFEQLSAHLASDGTSHTVESLKMTLTGIGEAQLKGKLQGVAPFALDAQATLAGNYTGHVYDLLLNAGGTLIEPEIDLTGEVDEVNAHLQAVVSPFDAIPLKTARLEANNLNVAQWVAGMPMTALSAHADLQTTHDESGELLLSGPVRLENRQPQPLDQGGVPLEAFDAFLHWTVKRIQLDSIRLSLLENGEITGSVAHDAPERNGEIAPLAFGSVQARLTLANIDTAAMDTRLLRQVISGNVEADANPADIRVTSALQSENVTLTLDGTLNTAETERPFTLTAQMRNLNPAAFFAQAPVGRVNLDAQANGTWGQTLALEAVFELPEGRLQEQPLSGKGRLKSVGMNFSDIDIHLDLAGNRLDAQGAWGSPEDRLTFAVSAPQLKNLGDEFDGTVDIKGFVQGGIEVPSGEITFSADALRLPGNIRLKQAHGTGRLEPGRDRRFQLDARLAGLGSPGESTDWIREGKLNAGGTFSAHVVELDVAGFERDSLAFRAEGGLREMTRWQGRLTRFETTGRVQLKLDEPVEMALSPDAVNVAEARMTAGESGFVRLEETRWSPGNSVFRGALSGLTLELTPRRNPARQRQRQRVSRDLTLGAEWNISITRKLTGEVRVFRESGDLRIQGGEMTTRLGLDLLEAVLLADGDRVTVSGAIRGADIGQLTGGISVQMENAAGGWRLDRGAPMSGSAYLSMPSIAWLGRLMEERVEAAGSVEGAFTFSGTPAQPDASGNLKAEGLEIALLDQGFLLSGGEVAADFNRDQLKFTRFSFNSPNRVRPNDGRLPIDALTQTPGTLEGTGEIALESGIGEFTFKADRLPILQRHDRWLILSGQGEAHSTWTSLNLQAGFYVNAGYIEHNESGAPVLSNDVVILGREEKDEGSKLDMTVNVTVALGDALYLQAFGLDTKLAGNIVARIEPERPLSVSGMVMTVGGVFKGYGQNLTIERGQINFQGAVDNPGLNVVALRKGLPVEAGVEVSGTVRHPQIRLVSEPSVSDPEKLSWIVLGRAPDSGGGTDYALLLPAAEALLGSSGFTSGFSRSLGLDEFSIGQGDLNSSTRTATSAVAGGGSTISDPDVTGQVITIGKRLTDDLMLSFEQSIGGAESLVKLSYQVSKRISLVLRGGYETALDLNYSLSFR